MAKEVVPVRLDPETIIALRMIAENTGVTVSDLIRWGVLKVIEAFRNGGRMPWEPKPKTEYKPRVLSEEQKQQARRAAQAQTAARAQLRKNHRTEHLQLVRDYGRAAGRSLLIQTYYEEYRHLYQTARRQQP